MHIVWKENLREYDNKWPHSKINTTNESKFFNKFPNFSCLIVIRSQRTNKENNQY